MKRYKKLNFILTMILLSMSIFAFNSHNCMCIMEKEEVSLTKKSCCSEMNNIESEKEAGNCSEVSLTFERTHCLNCSQVLVLDFSIEIKSEILRRDTIRSYYSSYVLEDRFTEFNLFEKFYYLSHKNNHKLNSYYLAEYVSDRAPPVLFV